MGVEIRQLVVKSNVLQRRESGAQDGAHADDARYQELLEEVRRMIAQALRQTRER